MRCFSRSAPLIAAITVSLYFQLALVPSVAWAQPAPEVDAEAPLDEGHSNEARPASEQDTGELPDISDVDRVLASLPSGGAAVGGNAVALPSGPATTLGMGESFSAQLSTGTAAMTVPFALPSARGHVQPSLALSYSSAGGFGLAGVGWSLGTAAITRQTDRGVPGYDDRTDFHPAQDRFMLGSAELVPICTVRTGTCDGALDGERMPAWANGWQYFRMRHEAAFVRVFWSPDHRTWRVQSKDGANMELGVPLDGTGYHEALDFNPDRPQEIFRWYLVREYDSQGGANDVGGPHPVNVLVFRYFHDDGVAYLSDIYDTSPASDPSTIDLSRFAHHTAVRYEQRPDPAISYRAGFRMGYRMRLAGVDVTSKPFEGGAVTTAPRELVRRFHVGYMADRHTSLLATVQAEGRCAQPVVEEATEALPRTNCPRLPAVRFEYQDVPSDAEPLRDGNGFAFEPLVSDVQSLPNSPPHSLDERDVAMFDANLDGLPDLLATEPNVYRGKHALFLNGQDGELGFGNYQEVPVASLNGVTAGVLRLSNVHVAPLDLDADGALDLVHMPFVKRYEVFSLGRGGQPGWHGREASTAADQDPKINFARDARDTRVMDVNSDGLVDIVYTSATEVQTFLALGRFPGGDGRFGQGTWTGSASADLTTEPIRSCAPWSAKSIRFSSPDVHAADMNGDGLPDLVRVRDRQILYWPGRGNGMWGLGDRDDCRAGEFGADRHIEMIHAPNLGVTAPGRTMLADLNGDGLSDMVELRARAVDVYLNENGEGWTERFTIQNTPFLPNSASYVQLSDIDGSGTPDLVWGKAREYQYVDLTGGHTPHLLIRTHNGLGRTMTLSYRSMTDLMREAERKGQPWVSTTPTAARVLVRAEITDNLERIQRPSTHLITEYSYRDPVFEGREREFRGFREATTRVVGDKAHPTSFVRSRFLLGECQDDNDDGIDVCAPEQRWREHGREALKGHVVLSETYDGSGVYHSTQHTAYELRSLYVGRDGRRVQVVKPVENHAFLYDTADFDGQATTSDLPELRLTEDGKSTEHAGTLIVRAERGRAFVSSVTTFDNFGNVTETQERGCSGAVCPAGQDETLIAHSDYALPVGDESGWLWREERSYVTGNMQTDRRNEVRHTYDSHGNPLRSFATLSGTLPLQRQHALGKTVAPAPLQQSAGIARATEILLTDNTFDNYGHIFWKRGAESGCVSTDVDPDYAHLLVHARTYVGTARPDGCGSVILRQEVTYDRGLEQITAAKDANDRPSRFEYDGFGRLVATYAGDPDRPGTLTAKPMTRMSYDLTVDPWVRPYSIIRVETLDGLSVDAGVYRASYSFVDGLSRTLLSTTTADPAAGDGGQWIVSGPVEYDAKGAVRRGCSSFFSSADPFSMPYVEAPTTDPAGSSTEPGGGCTFVERDAFGRTVNQYGYDGQLVTHTRYHALSTDAFDPTDLKGGEREGTYVTGIVDGHGRQVASIERYRDQGAMRERRQLVSYLPTGEVTRVTRRVPGEADFVRWMRYDSLGRLVFNVEPNTSVGFTQDDRAPADSLRALRYAYDDAGRLVGTSDARGCGVNYHYDAAGRPIAVDYSPCEAHHLDYTAPDLTTGEGTEAFYRYDSFDPEGQSVIDGAGKPFPMPSVPMLGALASVADRGSKAIYRYDWLGRGTGVALRIAKPGEPAASLTQRFAPRWYTRSVTMDALDRPLTITTGATTPELLGKDGESQISFTYAANGAVHHVDSSYGVLLEDSKRFADGRVDFLRMGDAAATRRQFAYDTSHRLQTVLTFRSSPPWWTSEVPSQISNLEHLEYHYDLVGNLIGIDDRRWPADWPAAAQPVSRSFQYDDLYRITEADYSYSGSSQWRSPYAAELSDVVRDQPTPHVSFEQRVNKQTFTYDAFNRLAASDDDTHAFWDRSTGNRAFGTVQNGPHQLRSASNRLTAPNSARKGDLEARYDGAGNMTDLAVKRDGPCLPTNASCWLRFHYQWDEIGNLTRARRWDLRASNSEREQFASVAAPGAQLLPARSPDAELRYAYAGTSRVRKTAIGPAGDERHTVYVFDSLELREATFDGDYALNADTEQVRLHGGPVVGRVVFSEEDLPTLTSGGQHLFLQFADHLGSNSFSIDHETGELVEYTTYSAFGGVESSFRPERWNSFREPYKLSGKEEDIEVGLVYFGARYYSPYAAMWLSPDPVNIHGGGSDINPYGYVGGSPLMNVDPDGRDFGITAGILIVAAISAAVCATANATSQAAHHDWDWTAIDVFSWQGVVGAAIIGFASGLAGGVAGAGYGGLAGVGSGAAAGAGAGAGAGIGGTMAVGAVGGAVGSTTGYLMSAGADASLSGFLLALGTGALSGGAGGGMHAALGNSWGSTLLSGAVAAGVSAGTNAAVNDNFSTTDFVISLASGLASVAAVRGIMLANSSSAAPSQPAKGGTTTAEVVEATQRALWVHEIASDPPKAAQTAQRVTPPRPPRQSQPPRSAPEPPALRVMNSDELVAQQTGARASSETVDLYRAVGVGEFNDVMNSGMFRAGGNSLEGRQFAMSLKEALQYANTDRTKVAVLKVTIEKSALSAFDFSTRIDPHIFTNGVYTVQPGAQSGVFHQALLSIEQAF